MSVVATDAILLRAYPWSEAGRVFKLYCRDVGLVSAMARRARTQASRGTGAANTFCEGVAVVAGNPARDLRLLRDFTPIKAHLGLGRDYKRLAGASAACDLVLRNVGEQPHSELYQVLSAGLDQLEASPSGEIPGAALGLAWRIVDVLGFGPELAACVRCARTLGDDEMGRFDVAAGGVACLRCRPPDGSRRVGPLARAAMSRLVVGAPPAPLFRARAHASLLGDFVAHHLLGGRPLQALRQFRDSLSAEDDVSPTR